MSWSSAIDVVVVDAATAILLPWLVMTSPQCKEAVLLVFRSSCLLLFMLLLTVAWTGVGGEDQIMMMTSMVLLSLHLPLCHLYDCCLMATD